MKKRFALALVLMCLTLCGCGKSGAIRNAEAKIAAIGIVTADSGAAIEEAEEAWNALSLKEREKVENAAELPAAREAWKNAVAEREERERQERLVSLRRQLIGTWEFTQDATEAYAELIDRVIGAMMGDTSIQFSGYVDRIAVTGNFTLLDNGTYKIGFTAAQLEAFLDSVITPFRRYYADMMRKLVAQELMMNGIPIEDIHSDEAWLAATGMDFDALMEADLGMSMESYIDYVLQSVRGMLLDALGANAEKLGNYRVEEGKLLLSGSLEEAVGEARYVTFALDGAALTLTGYCNVSEFGDVFPIQMRRAA